MPGLKLYQLGTKGVNVDMDPILIDDQELRQAQNAIHDIVGSAGGIRKRPGLKIVNGVAAAGIIIGGTSVPIFNQSNNGISLIYIGRYPVV